MTIDLHQDTTGRHIQGQFATRYPYLKLVFLEPADNETHHAEVPADRCIAAFSLQKGIYSLKIDPADTIADVEQLLSGALGLQVLILQQSHGHWIGPGGKGKLSLAAQNAAGEAAADHIIHPDYDTHIEKQDH